MKIGKIFNNFFSNKARVIIAGEFAKSPLHEGRARIQPEVPFFLKQKGLLAPGSRKTRK